MKTLFFALAACLLLSLPLQACSPTDGFVRPKGDGMSRVYPVTDKQAWNIAKTIFRWEGADAIAENRSKDYIVASVGKGPLSNGASMCVWINPLLKGDTMITVSSRHEDLTRATNFTEASFYWRFSQAVDIVNAGKLLPPTPPK